MDVKATVTTRIIFDFNINGTDFGTFSLTEKWEGFCKFVNPKGESIITARLEKVKSGELEFPRSFVSIFTMQDDLNGDVYEHSIIKAPAEVWDAIKAGS